jgi:phosphoribosylformylglycinamidine synthase
VKTLSIFQVLTEAGLLPGALARNAGLAFVCRLATVEVEADRHPLLGGLPRGTRLRLPVAHHDGRYVADPVALDALEQRGGVALRYLSSEQHEGNPNGSMRDIAGVFNERGNVLGMMPHPERVVEPLLGGDDGITLLRGFAKLAGVMS